jgi:cobaltochelatase CobS
MSNPTKAQQKDAANRATVEDGIFVHGSEIVGDPVYVHSVPAYLDAHYHTVRLTLEEYVEAYPDAPLYSPRLQKIRQAAANNIQSSMTAKVATFPATADRKEEFAKIFGLGDAPAGKNARGEYVRCTVLADPKPEYEDWIPVMDPDYIFPIDNLKAVMVAAELNMPMLVWGMHGTGKTTLIEGYCAGTNRPWIRVQHTVSTEEAHILGHYVVKNGGTMFEPGPLAIAMRDGLVYVADEYDFALPSVTSVYQAVLEGKPLVIKEAPPEWRIVKPHPNFRFYATGNTNGAGDETGLYTGTQIMNAANYSRFGVTIQMEYMDRAQEVAVVAGKARIHNDDATRLVQVAADIRRQFKEGDLSVTISPRELINAGKLARVFGEEPNLTKGMQLAFTNRLNDTDKQAVESYLQRHFG